MKDDERCGNPFTETHDAFGHKQALQLCWHLREDLFYRNTFIASRPSNRFAVDSSLRHKDNDCQEQGDARCQAYTRNDSK